MKFSIKDFFSNQANLHAQQRAYVIQTINQKKKLGMDSILREEKGQWWENLNV